MPWRWLAAALFYIDAVNNLLVVGSQIAQMIRYLIHANNITQDKIFFIGHSHCR